MAKVSLDNIQSKCSLNLSPHFPDVAKANRLLGSVKQQYLNLKRLFESKSFIVTPTFLTGHYFCPKTDDERSEVSKPFL